MALGIVSTLLQLQCYAAFDAFYLVAFYQEECTLSRALAKVFSRSETAGFAKVASRSKMAGFVLTCLFRQASCSCFHLIHRLVTKPQKSQTHMLVASFKQLSQKQYLSPQSASKTGDSLNFVAGENPLAHFSREV